MRRLVDSSRIVVLRLFFFVALVGCGDGSSTPQSVPNPLLAGPYPVGVTRIELFDASQGRTQLTEIWYPAAESARGQEPAPLASYLPEGLEALADNATVPLVAVRDAELAGDAPFPLIAFSHGNGGVRFQNTFQCEHLASHGFIVIAPDHEGNTFFDSSVPQSELIVARPRDIRFLLDWFAVAADEAGSRFERWVDTDVGFGVTGHSFGAFTALATAELDARIVAVMPLAFGVRLTETYSAATFFMLGTEDKTVGRGSVLDAYEHVPRPRFIAEILDAGHYSFTFACQVGLAGPWDGDGCGEATRIEGDSPFAFTDDLRTWDIVNGYSAAFFGRYIKGIASYEEILVSNLDPEVTVFTADP